MGKAQAPVRAKDIGDAAVQARTGKTWAEWFALLDRAGARRMTHREIAAYLHEHAGCPGWWSQMITVGYERERGLRVKNQAADGYQVSASRTLPVPLAMLYAAWDNEATRARWLPRARLTVRTATRNRSVRLGWGDGSTAVNLMFYAKGSAKSQIAVEHRKLPRREDVDKMRAYWTKALDRLAGLLAGAAPGQKSRA